MHQNIVIAYLLTYVPTYLPTYSAVSVPWYLCTNPELAIVIKNCGLPHLPTYKQCSNKCRGKSWIVLVPGPRLHRVSHPGARCRFILVVHSKETSGNGGANIRYVITLLCKVNKCPCRLTHSYLSDLWNAQPLSAIVDWTVSIDPSKL